MGCWALADNYYHFVYFLDRILGEGGWYFIPESHQGTGQGLVEA